MGMDPDVCDSKGRTPLRNNIQAASNFVCRNHLPSRLKEQILAYMCLRFRAETLNQQQLMEQLPKSICKSICQYLFIPIVEQVYLFKVVSRELLLLLVTYMRAEYIPPREDVIMQNEAPGDFYILVSGEVEIISCHMDKEMVLEALKSGRDMFGEISALCNRPQSITVRTKTLSQLLRLKQTSLLEALQTKPEDNMVIFKNFLQYLREIRDPSFEDLVMEIEPEGELNTCALLSVAGTENGILLEELLRMGTDPDVCDSKGRTPLCSIDALLDRTIRHMLFL